MRRTLRTLSGGRSTTSRCLRRRLIATLLWPCIARADTAASLPPACCNVQDSRMLSTLRADLMDGTRRIYPRSQPLLSQCETDVCGKKSSCRITLTYALVITVLYRRVSVCPPSLRVDFTLAPLFQDQVQEFLDLSFGGHRVHASEFQALLATDAGVPDDCRSAVEKLLADGEIDVIGIEAGRSRNVAEHNGTQVRLALKLKPRVLADDPGGVVGQADGAINHCSQFCAAERLE